MIFLENSKGDFSYGLPRSLPGLEVLNLELLPEFFLPLFSAFWSFAFPSDHVLFLNVGFVENSYDHSSDPAGGLSLLTRISLGPFTGFFRGFSLVLLATLPMVLLFFISPL